MDCHAQGSFSLGPSTSFRRIEQACSPRHALPLPRLPPTRGAFTTGMPPSGAATMGRRVYSQTSLGRFATIGEPEQGWHLDKPTRADLEALDLTFRDQFIELCMPEPSRSFRFRHGARNSLIERHRHFICLRCCAARVARAVTVKRGDTNSWTVSRKIGEEMRPLIFSPKSAYGTIVR